MARSSLQTNLENSNFSEVVKSIDAEIKAEAERKRGPECLQQLYFNRGYCYQQLDLNRKALKDFNESIRMGNVSVKVHLHRGQVLWSLGKKRRCA